MKKKLYAIYALVGALVASPVFTSCVDDTESQSVTELREAKAEQLKSIATLNNAKAQAETTLANAEAALKAAQAAQEQALADKTAAEAAYQEALTKAQELQNQLKEAAYDAELEAALAQAQADLAQAQADKLKAEKEIAEYQADMEKAALSLQKELAELEKQLLEAQKDLLQAEKDLADKKDQISKDELAEAEAKYQELKDLTSNYGNLLITYTQMSQNILSDEADLAAAQAELADWENLIAEDIAEQELAIELAQIQIDALKKYSNYTEDIDAIKIELEQLAQAWEVAKDKSVAAENAYNAIDIDELKSENKVSELEQAIYDNNLYFFSFPYAYMVAQYTPVKVCEPRDIVIEGEESTYYSYSDSIYVELEYQDVRQLEIEIEAEIATWDIKGKKEAIETPETGLQAIYDAAVKATAEADEQSYQVALDAELLAKYNLDTAIADLEYAEQQVADLQAAFAMVSDPAKGEEYLAAVEAYNKAITEIHTQKAEAQFAMDAAQKEAAEAEIAYNTLYAVCNGNGNGYWDYNYVSLYDLFYGSAYVEEQLGFNANYWGGSIDNDMLLSNYLYFEWWVEAAGENGAIAIADAIKAAEEAIKAAEETIENLKNTTDKENAIELLEVQLAAAKANQAAAKLELDALKAKVDALQAELTAE